MGFGGNAQTYKFSLFGEDEGIHHPFIYSIQQDRDGFLWIGTSEDLLRYDGFKFQTFPEIKELTTDIVTASFLDSKGTLWFGDSGGGVMKYDSSGFHKVKVQRYVKSTIMAISEDSRGNILVLAKNNCLVKIAPDGSPKSYIKAFHNYQLHCMEITPDDILIVGTNKGVLLYDVTGEEPSFLKKVSKVPMAVIKSITRCSTSNSFIVVPQYKGVFKMKIGQKDVSVREIGEQHDLRSKKIVAALEDQLGDIWLASFGNGLYKLSKGNQRKGTYADLVRYDKDNKFGSNHSKIMFMDRESNLWIGTFGDGLAVVRDNFFSFYPKHNLGNIDEEVHAITALGGYQWLGMKEGLLQVDLINNNVINYFTEKNSNFPGGKVTAILPWDENKLWIGTEKHGLYLFDIKKKSFAQHFLHVNNLAKQVTTMVREGGDLWVGTMLGLFKYNPEYGYIFHYNTENGLRHNEIVTLFLNSRKELWVSTPDNVLTIISNDKLEQKKLPIEGQTKEITSIAEDRDGNIWLGTHGEGVLKYHTGTFTTYKVDKGLKANYCYSVQCDKSFVWVGHRGGISQIKIDDQTAIKAFDRSIGVSFDFLQGSVYTDENDVIWFGTNKGVLQYDSKKDKKNPVPPIINLKSMLKFEEEIPIRPSGKITLDYDSYKITFNYIGLSLNDPENVLYNYRLTGQNEEGQWVPTKERSVTFNRLEEGEYVFELQACNSDGMCTTEPVVYTIKIKDPIWKSWWFILLSFISAVYLVFLYIRIRDRKTKKFQEFLKQELQKRTKEVVEQKEQIEEINKDLTDSINYAKRIQEAILPEDNQLRRFFPESFIHFRPRDIVSGDFYWMERYGSKLIVVCADCTGHGVPGAFMSMIGSILLKDICSVESINAPDVVLNVLDKEVNAVLKQNTVKSNTRDGMDIIICEFDMDTKILRFASAMRPMLIFRGGEIMEIKGDRFSIGGGYSERRKNFTLHEIQLQEGDVIYMFSDGVPDQFGGPNKKKLKVSGLWSQLEIIHPLSMEEQQDAFADFMEEWKGDLAQIDDILLIGIRIS